MATESQKITMEKYTLMHKEIPVVEFTYAESVGEIIDVVQVYNLKHMPVGTVLHGECNVSHLVKWWHKRAIPSRRYRLEGLECMRGTSFRKLIVKSYGLSLSDQYWVRKSGSDVSWSSVNFFDNDFSENFGNLYFESNWRAKLDPVTPDLTTDGMLMKRWKIIDGKRYLQKAHPGSIRYEHYNEVIATILCKSLQIPCADYFLVEGEPFYTCACEDFIDRSTEFINAYSVMKSFESSEPMELYDMYVNACIDLGYDVTDDLDRMIVLDFIMENHDRHFGNFGLIRDADTLKILGSAPIFDTGSSIRCNVHPDDILETQSRCRTFKTSFDEQLELVKSFDWIDFSKLSSSMGEVDKLLSNTIIEKFGIKDKILEILKGNISKLRAFVQSK